MTTQDHNKPVGYAHYEKGKLVLMGRSDACMDMFPLYTHPSDAAAQIAELNRDRDEWKDSAINGGNAGYLREQIAKLEEQLRTERMNTEVWMRDAQGKLEDRTEAYHQIAKLEAERDAIASDADIAHALLRKIAADIKGFLE